MTTEQLNTVFRSFNDQTILIVGDVMVDAYLWGRVDRMSPEAPVPVVSVTKSENRLGGAANVALNISALGTTPLLCSAIGDDEKGEVFRALLTKRGLPDEGIITVDGRPTTVKTRVLGNNQQMMRVDQEVDDDLHEASEDRLIAQAVQLVTNHKIDAIIFQDYNKGVLTKRVIRSISELARKHSIPTAADPKKNNFLAYEGVTLFKPNLKELKEGLNRDLDHTSEAALFEAVAKLQEHISADNVIVTLSRHGVFAHSKEVNKLIPAHIRNIADVSGAGDTVISVAATCLAAGLDIETIATLANLAGGQVCEKAGVVPLDKEQLLKEAIGVFA